MRKTECAINGHLNVSVERKTNLEPRALPGHGLSEPGLPPRNALPPHGTRTTTSQCSAATHNLTRLLTHGNLRLYVGEFRHFPERRIQFIRRWEAQLLALRVGNTFGSAISQ